MAAGELVLAILSRNDALKKEAFELVMAAHERMVVSTAYRLLGRMEDARDAAQEAFLRLFRHFERIEGDPKWWLYRVTVNICNDYHRRAKQVQPPDERQIDPSPGPEQSLAIGERKQLLMEGLQTLAPRERESVVLRDIEGLSTREVAQILGIEEVTVRSLISVARVKLAKYVRSRR